MKQKIKVLQNKKYIKKFLRIKVRNKKQIDGERERERERVRAVNKIKLRCFTAH